MLTFIIFIHILGSIWTESATIDLVYRTCPRLQSRPPIWQTGAKPRELRHCPLNKVLYLSMGLEWNRVHRYCGHLWTFVPAMDDCDDYGTIGMISRGTEVLGGNLPQCRFVHHKSHKTLSRLEQGRPLWEADVYPPELWRGPDVDVSTTCHS
jgi:hypothetical protein